MPSARFRFLKSQGCFVLFCGHLVSCVQHISGLKPVAALPRSCGFTAEELDFILNYDIKYRLGRDISEED